MASRSSGRARREAWFALVFALLALGTWFALRLVLYFAAGPMQLAPSQTAAAFAVGTWFDLATLAYVIAPVLLATAMLPDRWRGHRVTGILAWATLVATVAILLFGAVSEYVFWDEFSTRFNFIAVDYLIYTSEVIGNIRQSYPVPLILAFIAGMAALAVWLLSRRVQLRARALGWRRRLACAAAAVLLPVLATAAANIDQMSGAGSELALELSGNGLFSFAAAMRRNELDYDRFYLTIPQEEADAILLALGVERLPLSKVMQAPIEPEPGKMGPFSRSPRNVILISVESLSAEFLGAYGSKKNLTPQLDRLAAEGLKFEHAYATGTRTVRGLEALSLGTPPIPGQAILRRPNNDHLTTIGQFLKYQGFAPYFIYGGYGYFDNMNAYFDANDYAVIDRVGFPKESIPFANVWGVADEALFANALRILDAPGDRGQRFFAHIMTTSNHRPFTYPEGRIDIASPGGRDGAVKYTDFAIGQFIEAARKKPWFKDTLFVIVADHCASAAGKTKLPIKGYQIPVIFYAPDMLKPGVFAKMVSQVDLPPTLLDLLDVKGDDHFFGDSLFEHAAMPARAFVSNYQELGYYKDGTLTVLLPRQKVQAYRIDPVTYEAAPAEVDPVLLKEAIAFYQSGSRAFKRNRLKNPDFVTAGIKN